MDGETLSLDEDLRLLKEKLPKSFLDEVQNEVKGNYTTQLHTTHKTPPTVMQMNSSGKFFLG
jgi:hypothetical protein